MQTHPKTAHLPPLDEIVAMYQTGLAASQIAEQLHTSEKAILRRLKEAGATRSNAEAQKQAHVQGRAKAVRYWAGKKQPDAMVKARSEKISGPNHYAWKGGKAKRDYRKNVQKEACEMCETRQNLGIHHKDL